MKTNCLTAAERAIDLDCLKERNNYLAVKRGMPSQGTRFSSGSGFEWYVDGHTTARGISGSEDMYPVIAPMGLSERLLEFAAEIDRCTPKAIVLLDTLPLIFPSRGHTHGHWVDAWSDPFRILIYLDAEQCHGVNNRARIGSRVGRCR